MDPEKKQHPNGNMAPSTTNYGAKHGKKHRSSLQPDSQLRIVRPILNQPLFDANFGLVDPGPPLTPWEEIKRIGRKQWNRKVTSTKCGPRCAYSFLASWFPVLDWIPKYEIRKLAVADFVAVIVKRVEWQYVLSSFPNSEQQLRGLTVGVMNVPQGIAYSILAGLPPVCGLYTSFIPTLFYFAMGTSRQCSLGTFAVISMMTNKIVGNTLETWNEEHLGSMNGTENIVDSTGFTPTEQRAMSAASLAAFLTGCWQLAFGILGFGALTVYLSDQLVQGFTCSASFHVFSSQLGNVFGLNATILPEPHGIFKIIRIWKRFFEVITLSHPPTIIIAIVTMVFLIIVKYGINHNKRIMAVIRVPVPAELLVVIIGASVSYSFDFKGRYNVTIVNRVPLGMPPAAVPDFSLAPSILGDTFALAIVGFAITVTLGMLFASKHHYAISPNQEFKAMGVGNIFGGFFQCFPSGASLARSAVQDGAGGRTQMVSLVQCVIVLVTILALGPLLQPLPRPCLGGIVMVAVFHLLSQVAELVRLWKLSFVDWMIFLVVFLAVLILDVDIGVGIGTAFAIMTVMFRLQKPKVRGMGRMQGTDLYKPIDIYTSACPIPNIRIVRVDAPIYFANAAYIKTRLYNLAGLSEAMHQLRIENDDTEDPSGETNYAFTNTLVMEDGEAETTAAEVQYNGVLSRKRSSISLQQIVSMDSNGICQPNGDSPVMHIIIDCSEVCFVDVTGVAFLKATASECESIGVKILLACTNKPVRDAMKICGADAFIGPQLMFITVHDAVMFALNSREQKSPPSILFTTNEEYKSDLPAKDHDETKM